jgi:hypothetical protein
VNGIADGAVYVAGKDNMVYALYLTTGAQLWSYNALADVPNMPGALRSTAAVLGNTVYLGTGVGVVALNAVTGAEVWQSQNVGPTMSQVLSSPGITGPSTGRVLFVGDAAGVVHALNLSTGASLWTYNTSSTVYASPAISNGLVYMAAGNGLLYEYGLGSSRPSAAPHTVLSVPTNNDSFTMSGGQAMTLSGSASDDKGVQAVNVAIKNKNTGKWWDAASGTWVSEFWQSAATLGTPNGASTTWSASFPVSSAGASYYIQAIAVDTDNQHDPQFPSVTVLVETGSPPSTSISNPTQKEIFYFPSPERFPVDVTGTATDSSSAKNPGITAVDVVIENLGHREYYCGYAGCNGGQGSGQADDFGPTYTVVQATLANPGAASTSWSITFDVYDHPHDYRIVVWAVDSAGVADPTRPSVMFCTREPGDNVCD